MVSARGSSGPEGVAVELEATVAERGVQLSLQIEPGETLAVLGPNGAGKSTLLGVLSGLVRPDSGRVQVGSRTLVDLAEGRSVWTPPHARGVGLLAQDPLLFPHLTALENVAFGPRALGSKRVAAKRQAMALLERVGLAELAARRPHQVSGGQAQRVALARALAAAPEVLLLDEPLSALDIDAKPEVRQVLLELLPGLTTVVVTHDVLDAVLLADRVAVIEDGSVVELGRAAEVLATPRSAFAARIAGLNLIDGAWDGEAVRASDGQRIHVAPTPALAPGVRCRAVFRPTAVAIYAAHTEGSPRNELPVQVSAIEPHGDLVRVRAGALSADITAASALGLRLRPGMPVVFTVKATEVTAYALG
ncbi:sulfate/molybdate ABC transporter ATP-binding protein [Nocardioides daejeonensis]|uniref:sulfate/molybdate ABC transporter ATP-binding protein n=1 Tax=Nocardioides daejeonensis TaxID=1046556 RepID=UPI000D747A92|nr:ABC transporter ATP-binding protein [Nocardioides daejeonensis]